MNSVVIYSNHSLFQFLTYMVSECLWRIVHNDGLRQISAKNLKVFDVVSIYTDTMLPEQTVP